MDHTAAAATPNRLQTAARRFQLQWKNASISPWSHSNLDFDTADTDTAQNAHAEEALGKQTNTTTTRVHVEADDKDAGHHHHQASDDDSDSEIVLPSSNTNMNIDQALQSLYDNNHDYHASSSMSMSSSFVAQTEPDWLLDGWCHNHDNNRDEQQLPVGDHCQEQEETVEASSARLLGELYPYSHDDGETRDEWLEHLADQVAKLSVTLQLNDEHDNDDDDDDDNDDGFGQEDDFGDFQSACTSEEPEPAACDQVRVDSDGNDETAAGSGCDSDVQVQANDNDNEETAALNSKAGGDNNDNHGDNNDDASGGAEAASALIIPHRIDNDEEEEDATCDLTRRADDLLASLQSQSPDALGSTRNCSKIKSPNNDGDSEDEYLPPTPLLVRQSEALLFQAAAAVVEPSQACGEVEQRLEDLSTSPLPIIVGSSSHDDDDKGDMSVQVAWSPVRLISLNQRHVRQRPPQQQQQQQYQYQTEEPSVPISLQLPVTDLGTLEGRFTRRRKQHFRRIQQQQQQDHYATDANVHVHDDYDIIRGSHSQGHSTHCAITGSDMQQHEEFQLAAVKQLEGLPSYYFNKPNFDDTGRVMELLPWHYVIRQQHQQQEQHHSSIICEDYETSDWALWDNHMTDQLCRLDTALETVKSQLLHQVQPHESHLQTANERIHDWEQNLRLATMYWERAHESVQQAIGLKEDVTGVMGSSVLLQTWQQREEYQDLSGTLEQVADVLAKEQQVLTRIDSFDARQDNAVEEYYAVMELTKELQATVCGDGALSGLSCLDDMRSRLGTMRKRFWHRLHVLSESVAVRCCRGLSFDWAEYESLVRSVLDLHSKGIDEESSDDVDLGTSWSNNIVEALCYEADRAFAISLLDPDDPDESNYERELMQLSREVELDWGDSAKLRTLSHNLVTIRFDFEYQSNYLPRVFRRLCAVLSDVLHAHFLFMQWHAAPFDDQSRNVQGLHEVRGQKSLHLDGALRAIHSGLNLSRTRLWDHCEHVMTKCFDEHLNFSARRELFEHDANGTNDSAWRQDLDGLHQVLLLTDRFVSLKRSFFEEKAVESSLASMRSDGAEWPLHDKLSDVFRKHLRSVHVEAMNNMGRLLSKETWRLTTLVLPADMERKSQHKPTVEGVLVSALNAASTYRGGNSKKTAWGKVVDENGPPAYFNLFVLDGNPFESMDIESLEFTGFESTHVSDAESASTLHSGVYQPLNAMLRESNERQARIAPECVARGLIVWVSRLLTVMERLPLIVEDTSVVFANLGDLYFATVLRLCVGSARDEQILLGVNQPSPLVMSHDETSSTAPSGRRSPSSPLFGFSRKGNGSAKSRPPRPQVAIPTSLEADICAPLPRDHSNVDQLKQFIQRAQRSLQGIVNLDRVGQWLPDPIQRNETLEEHTCAVARTLEQRRAALCSCFVVAALFDVACSVSRINLSSTFLGGTCVDYLATLKSFVHAVLEATPTLVAVASQMACVRAVAGMEVVTDILKVGAGWEECKLNEHPNDYIDDLCDRCALLWGFLAASGKLPSSVLKVTWEQIVTGVYLSLLEGFARVPFCSTEGRALMTLDLASFSVGIDGASIAERLEGQALPSTPPKVNPDRGMRYVDTYIKVFYYPKEDIARWIDDNFTNYRLNHSLALVSGAGDVVERSHIDLLKDVKALYRHSHTSEEDG